MSDSAEHVTTNFRWVSLCTVLSRILGLVRDAAMAALFGNGPLLDAFTVAFRIPNMARALLGEGALATAFLPAYLAERERSGREAAARLATAVVVALCAALMLVIGGIELALIVAGTCCEWTPSAELLRRLLICLTPYLGCICLAAQLSALLNAERCFLVPALVPTVLNLIWLAGLGCALMWRDPERQLFVMSGSILVGGLAQVAFPLAALYRQGMTFDRQWRLAWGGVREIAAQILPVVGGLMVMQINVLIDSLLAWGFTSPEGAKDAWLPLSVGTASALYFGQRLYQFPLGVFGVALGTVLFPLLTEHAQTRQWDRLRDDFSLGLRYVAAIGIPASVGLLLLAHPLASLFFEYGAFDGQDVRDTAGMIAAYGSGVWAYCGLLIIHRGFYALGDRLTPLRVGIWSVLGNVVLSLSLIWVWGGVGLALATAIVSMLQCLAAGVLFREKIGGWGRRSFGSAVVLASLCAAAMGMTGYATLMLLADWPGWAGRVVRVAIPFAVAVTTYFGAARIVRFHDPFAVIYRRRKEPSEP